MFRDGAPDKSNDLLCVRIASQKSLNFVVRIAWNKVYVASRSSVPSIFLASHVCGDIVRNIVDNTLAINRKLMLFVDTFVATVAINLLKLLHLWM